MVRPLEMEPPHGRYVLTTFKSPSRVCTRTLRADGKQALMRGTDRSEIVKFHWESSHYPESISPIAWARWNRWEAACGLGGPFSAPGRWLNPSRVGGEDACRPGVLPRVSGCSASKPETQVGPGCRREVISFVCTFRGSQLTLAEIRFSKVLRRPAVWRRHSRVGIVLALRAPHQTGSV